MHVELKAEPCEYCNGCRWTISATLLSCDGCGVLYGRVNGVWVLDPGTVPDSGPLSHDRDLNLDHEDTP